jgi:hypothetical protein
MRFPQGAGGASATRRLCGKTAVLPFFPLDGAPWQRAGAIAYLEAAAFKGMNGDVYVSEFLESPRAALLTDEERGRLLHILRK